MAGPIRNLLATIRDRQPVRSAIRGMFGIDSFDEMASRDREQGNDISNAFPDTGMAPAKYPVQQAAQMEGATEDQPYKGKGVLESMFTPAPRIPKQPAAPPPVAAPMGLQQQLDMIEADPKLSGSAKSRQIANAFMRASLSGPDKQREQMALLGQEYMQQSMFEKVQEDEQKFATDQIAENKRLAIEDDNRQQAEFDRTSPAGRQKQVKALLEDPSMSPELAASLLVNDVVADLQSKGQTYGQTDRDLLADSLARTGHAHRINQSLGGYLSGKESMPVRPGHPYFEPMAEYYRQMAKDKGVVQAQRAIRSDMAQAVFSAVASQPGIDPDRASLLTMKWIERVATDILGDMAEEQGLWPTMPSISTEAFTGRQ